MILFIISLRSLNGCHLSCCLIKDVKFWVLKNTWDISKIWDITLLDKDHKPSRGNPSVKFLKDFVRRAKRPFATYRKCWVWYYQTCESYQLDLLFLYKEKCPGNEFINTLKREIKALQRRKVKIKRNVSCRLFRFILAAL